MSLVLQFVSSRTACFEFINQDAYLLKESVDIYLNDEIVISQEKRNVFSLFNLSPNTEYKLQYDNKNLLFKTKEESFCLNVKDFNAYGDGVHHDGLAFQAAISILPKDGVLYVPAGTYLVTCLFLKSNMTLYLDKDAKIIATYDRNEFPILKGIHSCNDKELNYGTWEGAETNCFASTMSLLGIQNVQIVGEGEIDEQAYKGDWYENHRVQRVAWRPFGMYIARCEDITVHGITIQNSPSWNVHPYFSKKLKFLDMKIFNPAHMPTTDGLDPDCCQDVLILGIYFSVGDDCIAIKSGTYELAKKYKVASERITIRNCLMEKGHGGVVFGSESSGGINDIKVENCYFKNTDRGLRIKTRRGRGRVGIINNVDFNNIIMDNVLTPFVINMYYNMGPAGGHEEYVWTLNKQPYTELTPYVGTFHFKNMKCFNVGYSAGDFLGLAEAPIEKIILENIEVTYNKNSEAGYPSMIEFPTAVKNQGFNFLNVKHVIFKKVKMEEPLGERYILNGVEKFENENKIQ